MRNLVKYILIIVILCIIGCNTQPTPSKYELLKQGEVVNIEYISIGTILITTKTVLHFKDSSTYIISGHRTIPSKYVYIYMRHRPGINSSVVIRDTRNKAKGE